jgi:hypothetical protein
MHSFFLLSFSVIGAISIARYVRYKRGLRRSLAVGGAGRIRKNRLLSMDQEGGLIRHRYDMEPHVKLRPIEEGTLGSGEESIEDGFVERNLYNIRMVRENWGINSNPRRRRQGQKGGANHPLISELRKQRLNPNDCYNYSWI